MSGNIHDTNVSKMRVLINDFINELEEIFLRHLTGNLSFDIANKPIDTIPKHNYEFKLSDLNKVLPNDDYAADKRVNAQDITDPIGPMGAGATLPDKRYQQLLKLKRELKQKKDFPDKIKRDLGIGYFTKNLNIPEDPVTQFEKNPVKYWTKPKKVIVLNASPRAENGYTDFYLKPFIKGMRKKTDVELVHLNKYKIKKNILIVKNGKY